MKKEKKKMTAKQKEEWFDAVRDNDIHTIQKMIEEGIDVNIKYWYGWTALHDACHFGYIKMVELLLSSGAEVNIQENRHLRTPLHLACYRGNLDITKLFISNGAYITAKDNDGNTPLDDLKGKHPQQYEKLMQWITEHHPEKLLEYMASESVQGRGIEL